MALDFAGNLERRSDMSSESAEAWRRAGEAFKARMDERGMSIADVARRADLDRATIREISTGVPRRRPSSTLAKASLAVGWTVPSLQDLLDGREAADLEVVMVTQPQATSDLEEKVGRAAARMAFRRGEVDLATVEAEILDMRDRLTRVEQLLLRLLGGEPPPGLIPRGDQAESADLPLGSRSD